MMRRRGSREALNIGIRAPSPDLTNQGNSGPSTPKPINTNVTTLCPEPLKRASTSTTSLGPMSPPSVTSPKIIIVGVSPIPSQQPPTAQPPQQRRSIFSLNGNKKSKEPQHIAESSSISNGGSNNSSYVISPRNMAATEPFSHANSSMPDFAIAEPTPHTEFEDTQHLPTDIPLRYGAVIRLWISDVGTNGGFLGYAARDLRRIKGELPQGGRFNVGMNDTFFVVPPFRPNRGWHFKETYFKLEDPKGTRKDGEGVRYGEEVLLIDEEENVMCHFRGRKYVRRKPKGTKGEMTVAFIPADEIDINTEITYGDSGIRLRLTTRKGLRTEAVMLSALRRDGMDAIGGFLNCLGQGKELRFDIEHAPPRISDISFTSTLVYGRKFYVNRSMHHHVHWGEQMTFSTPSCQGHEEKEHEGCTIRVTLSNGARLKMRQEHLNPEDKGRRREVWVPTKGMPGENIDLLVRLVHVDTTTADPHRHFVPASEVKSKKTKTLNLGMPIGLIALFALIALAIDPAADMHFRLQQLGRTALSFILAYLVYLGYLRLEGTVAHLWEQPDSPSSSSLRTRSTSDLPSSMLFDRWHLIVLDWRIAGEIDEPPPPLPPAFIEAENGDIEKARARWEKTLQWRRDNDVDAILHKPHPKFRFIKTYYPQVFHFRDKLGHVCFYEILGKLDVDKLLKNGVDMGDLTRHVILQQEFLWKVLQPNPHERVTILMDLKGVSFADVTGEVINFAKTAVGLTSTHYPARSYRMIILHVPGWFNLIFRFIKPMLNEAMKKKIVFMDESAVKDGTLLHYIDSEYCPKQYGGTCEVPLGESPFEKQLLDLVETALEEADMDFIDE